jgi:hypothetical protein
VLACGAGRPQELFEWSFLYTPGGRPYALEPDGRFLMVVPDQAEPVDARHDLVIVQTWFEELKRLVPAD